MTVHQCYWRYQVDDLALRELVEHLLILDRAPDGVLTSAAPFLMYASTRLLGRLQARVPEPEPDGWRERVSRALLG